MAALIAAVQQHHSVLVCVVVTMMLVTFVVGAATPLPFAEAKHKTVNCSINIYAAPLLPVYYLGEPRNNPDGTYYAGDAFHYIFRWDVIVDDDEGGCHAGPIRLDSAQLTLNHTSVGGHVEHRAYNNPRIAHTETYGYHAAKMEGDRCVLRISSPGESHLFWVEKWRVYDEPFLTKAAGTRSDHDGRPYDLTRYEIEKRKGVGSDDSWVYYHIFKHRNMPSEPLCDQQQKKPRGNIPIPAELFWKEESGGGRHNKGIVQTKMHTWAIIYSNTHTHHNINVTADPSTAFAERLKLICSEKALKGEKGKDRIAGCVYGTALIETPPDKLCIYDYLESIDIDPLWPPAHQPPNEKEDPAYLIPTDSCWRDEIGGGPSMLELSIIKNWHIKDDPVGGIKEITKDNKPPMDLEPLTVITSKPPLHHNDGFYDAKNLDGTYYHNDPIHIEHEPSWKWHTERHKHINFTLQRLHVQMPLVDDAHCFPPLENKSEWDGYCDHTIELEPAGRWHDESRKFGNGQGSSTYIPQTNFAFANYTYGFRMQAWNVDAETDEPTSEGEGYTFARVVPYSPVFGGGPAPYPYFVLGDGHQYSYGNRYAVAVQYLGSLDAPADGKDRSPVIHSHRRALLNDWNQTAAGGYGLAHNYTYFEIPHTLNDTRNIIQDNKTKLPNPVWAPTHTYNKTHVDGKPITNLTAAYTPHSSSLMFVRDGWSTTYWDWPAYEAIFPLSIHSEQGERRTAAAYSNVSAALTTNSKDFAGRQTTDLFATPLLYYTDTPFRKNVAVISVDHNGTIQTQDKITVRLIPYLNDTEYLAPYIHDKILYDTNRKNLDEAAGGDPDAPQTITDIVLADVYDMQQNQTGHGKIEAEWNRTTIHWGDMEAYWQISDVLMGTIENKSQTNLNWWDNFLDDWLTGLPAELWDWWGSNETQSATEKARSTVATYMDSYGLAPPDTMLDLEPDPRFDTMRMLIPLHIGLEMPSPTTYEITVNDTETFLLSAKHYEYGGGKNNTFVVEMNMRKDNPLETERVPNESSPLLRLKPPSNFGVIEGVYLNYILLENLTCTHECTIYAINGTVSVANKWGGSATAEIETPKEPPKTPEPWPFESGVLTIALMAVLVIVILVLRRVLRQLADD